MTMTLKVLVPFAVFADWREVVSVVAETAEGSFGLLWHRRDCAVVLAPGILICESRADGESYVAVDAGVLIKTGADVLVSVRRAIGGTDLVELREAVKTEFLSIDEQELGVRAVLAKLETRFLRRLSSLHHA